MNHGEEIRKEAREMCVRLRRVGNAKGNLTFREQYSSCARIAKQVYEEGPHDAARYETPHATHGDFFWHWHNIEWQGNEEGRLSPNDKPLAEISQGNWYLSRWVTVGTDYVHVCQRDVWLPECNWAVGWRIPSEESLKLKEKPYMASKYLAAAVAKKEVREAITDYLDPMIFKDRPAIQEFMTLVRKDDGTVRETAVLMVCMSTDGIRVGLKDDDAGGWCWRTAETLAKALTAIEKAIQAGEARFGGSKAGAANKKGGKG